MVNFKIISFIFCCLIIYLTRDCFGALHTKKQQDCIDEINKIFLARYTISKAPRRKEYAKEAYLHLITSDDPILDSFTKVYKDIIVKKYDDAKEFYKHIPEHIEIGKRMKEPHDFCILEQKISGQKFIKVYAACMGQIALYNIPLSNDKLTVMKTIYYDVVLDIIPNDYEYVRKFIDKSIQGFHINDEIIICVTAVFVFYFLYLNHDCLGYQTPKQEACIQEINTIFKVPKSKNLERKHYARCAYLNLRISTNPELDTFTKQPEKSTKEPEESTTDPEESTYEPEESTTEESTTDPEENTYVNAKKYYNYIISTPDHFRIDTSMELPKNYCKRKQIQANKNDLDIYLACIYEVQFYQILVSENHFKVIESIYLNVVFKEIEIAHVYVTEYVHKNRLFVHPIPPMKTPEKFCRDLYPTALEHENYQSSSSSSPILYKFI